VKQINDNPTGAGFQVGIKLVKEGRAIAWIVFEVLKTKERHALDTKLKAQEKQLGLFDVRLKTTTYEKAKVLASGWDIYILEAEWKEWGREQKEWPPLNPDGAFLGFCKQRGPYPRNGRERP
jgi:plasmid replication initiation protein